MGWHVKAKQRSFRALESSGFDLTNLRKLEQDEVDEYEDWDFEDIKWWLHDAGLAGRYLIASRDLKTTTEQERW